MRRLLRHVCLLRPVALGVVVLLNALHPAFHAFEGGSLDVVLLHLDMWAMAVINT